MCCITTSVDGLPAALRSHGLASRGQPNFKTEQEDMFAAASAYVVVMTNPAVGTNQNAATSWSKIYYGFVLSGGNPGRKLAHFRTGLTNRNFDGYAP
jgi:hypothetical protein